MFPIIKHEPFKRVNLLLNTGNLFSDDRRFADLILKDKLSDYLYNDTEEFETTILSFTPEQKNDLLEAMKVFNKHITELLFETYYDQCKKDKRERWAMWSMSSSVTSMCQNYDFFMSSGCASIKGCSIN